ncbi:Nuclear protein NP60 [Danaus plexippus plexippus]|uniref:Nuclear protein NP60 n=1 Tax=Danaus plexippus plexippus TaxID=278856 RepID=A0A212FNF2_DANPL|nr:Nuclear protein NP60 [Danaus plexippus plexippus]
MSVAYKLGDLVWAKMKGFSPWPGRVAIPTPELKPPKKAMNVQCIYFFGTNNYAWIEEHNIKPYQEHKEQLIKSCKTTAFKEAVAQIEEYIENPEKWGDFEEHVRNPEEEFDKLKDVMKEESSDEKQQEEEPSPEVKKKSSTPKIRYGFSKVKPVKRSSSAGLKPTPRKKAKSVSRSFTDTDIANEKPSMLNHSFSKKSSLLHRPSNILRPDTPPLDLENVSETLLEKNIKASQMKFGFLGLGIMGSGIVKNLLNSGHKVLVWNRTAAKGRLPAESTPPLMMAGRGLKFNLIQPLL